MPHDDAQLRHQLNEIGRRLDKLRYLFWLRYYQQESFMSVIDDLTARVAAQKTVDDSVIQLLQNLKAAVDAAIADPAKLQELSDTLASEQQRVTAAVVANTPAAP